jgi:hypothetical protein
MAVKRAAPVLSDIANAEFSFSDDAMVITEEAVDLILFQFLIKKGFFQHGFSFPVKVLHKDYTTDSIYPMLK